jgi:hypothetical protein
MSQTPSKLIERRSETADEIPYQHRNGIPHPSQFNAEDMENIIKVCMLGDGIGFYQPKVQFELKRIEMHLRPAGFHIYVDKFLPRPELDIAGWHHETSYATVYGQSSK